MVLFIDFGVDMKDGVNGVGLRACELAHALASQCEVCVVVDDAPHEDIMAVWPAIQFVHSGQVRPGRGDVYWFGFATPIKRIAQARANRAICIFDAIVWPLEFLTFETVRAASNPRTAYQARLGRYLRQLRLAHKYIVATPTERHVVVGMLSTAFWSPLHRLTPDLDAVFLELPIGFSGVNESSATALRPTNAGEKVVLVWNGGTWNHYDPAAAVEAVALLHAQGLRVELRFLYPQRGTETASLRRAREAARGCPAVHFAQASLGLLERVAALREATASICAYSPHALWDLCPPMRLRETLIYQLPVVAPRRGALGDLIVQHGIGATSEGCQPTQLADAILAVTNPTRRHDMCHAIDRLASRFRYESMAGDVWKWMNEGEQLP